MIKEIVFGFYLDEIVLIKISGEKGIVSFLGFDEDGPQYSVKTKEGQTWWKESQIEKIGISETPNG